MNEQNDKKVDKRISSFLSAVDSSAIPPDKQSLNKLQEQSTAEFLASSAHKNARLEKTTTISLWRLGTKSRITKIAAAAVIIIAAVLAVQHFSGSIDGTTAAWANTLEQIYKATSVRYNQTFYVKDRDPFTGQKMVNEKGVIRSILYDQPTIYDFGEGKTLRLIPNEKKAILTHRVGRKKPAKPYNQLDFLVSIRDRAGEFLGTESIDGKLANKFFWDKGEYDYTTIWVDPSTDLPLKVEQVSLPNPNEDIIQPTIMLNLADFGGKSNESRSVTIGGGKGIQNKMIIIITDFVWNEELDPALFSLVPPEDYTLVEKQFDASEPGENGFIEALAFWTEMSGGSFPQKINELIDPNQINQMLIEKFDGDGDPYKEIDEAMKQANTIIKGVYFAFEKKADGTWGYAGGDIHLGEAEKVVCWWKLEDSQGYRVIYGDLSIGVSAEELQIEN
jgi:hypothetical protein